METSDKNSNAGSIVLHVLGWTFLGGPNCRAASARKFMSGGHISGSNMGSNMPIQEERLLCGAYGRALYRLGRRLPHFF